MNQPNQSFPKSFQVIASLQDEFDTYQRACFPERGPHFFALELNGEAGELANLEKKDWKGLKIHPDAFSDEAADVMIALLNYCNSRKINLAKAVEAKMNSIEQKRLIQSDSSRTTHENSD